MRHCSNPHCWSFKRYGIVAEYSDDVARCAECRAALSDGPAPRPAAPVVAPAHAALWVRAAVTALAAALAAAAGGVLLPMVDVEQLATYGQDVSLAALGLTPFALAFVLVELVALVVPPLRPWRVGGPRGRRPLVIASAGLGVVLALLHASVTTTAVAAASPTEAAAAERWTYLCLVGTTVGLFALTRLVERFGLGNGFSVILLASLAPELWRASRSLLTVVPEPVSEGAALLTVLLVVGVGVGTAYMLRSRHNGRPATLRLPASGIAPLVDLGAIAVVPLALARIGLEIGDPQDLLPQGEARRWLEAGLIATLAAALTLAFNRPAAVARLRTRLGDPARLDQARADVRTAVLHTVAFLIGLRVIAWSGEDLSPVTVFPALIGLVVGTAVLLDLHSEWRFRATHRRVTAVWPLHRVYAVAPVLGALDRAGIEALARGTHHRALLHIFGPFVPIEVMVPADRASEAHALLARRLADGADERPPAPRTRLATAALLGCAATVLFALLAGRGEPTPQPALRASSGWGAAGGSPVLHADRTERPDPAYQLVWAHDAPLLVAAAAEDGPALRWEAIDRRLPRVIFAADPAALQGVDFPANDLGWPIVSRRMLDVLRTTGDFSHRIRSVVIVDRARPAAELVGPRGRLRAPAGDVGGYVVIVPDRFTPIDAGASRFRQVGGQARLSHLALGDASAPPFFRIRGAPALHLVSGIARDALLEADLGGLRFVRITRP